jgi:hypothetical protein
MTIADLLIFLAMTSAFGYALVSEILELINAIASRRWPLGEAEVIRALTEEQKGRRRKFVPVVEFRYQHDGREYLGSRLVFGSMFNHTKAEAAAVVERFQPGTRWAVSIDPQRPHVAVIQPGPHAHNWIAICFLGTFTAFTATFLVRAARDVTAHYTRSLPASPALERAHRTPPGGRWAI